MTRRRPSPVKTDVLLCLEICYEVDALGPRFAILGSIPGREGVIRYCWRSVQGRLDEGQGADIAATVGQLVTAALVKDRGLQLVVPMD